MLNQKKSAVISEYIQDQEEAVDADPDNNGSIGEAIHKSNCRDLTFLLNSPQLNKEDFKQILLTKVST